MLEMKVTIAAAADFMTVLNNLAAALDSKAGVRSSVTPVNPEPVPMTTPVVQAVTAEAPADSIAPTSAVPTAAPHYTLEMIATAGSALVDAGKMEQLMQLLGRFGVASLTELAPENYGAAANELRALGAVI